MSSIKTKTLWMASFLMAVALSACSGTDGTDGQRGDSGVSTLVTTAEEPAGDNCAEGGRQIVFGGDVNGDGVLSDDEIEGSTFVCHGDPGADGEAGADGEDGAPSLIETTEEPAGANCANGGLRVDYGVDDNQDGVLDDDEFDGTDYVCDGEDALDILVEVSDEPSGANCTSGGQKIETGSDTNADGVLEPSEVNSTTYVCDGNDGQDGLATLVSVSDEPAGANCDFGGQKIEHGVDADLDGSLSAGEVTGTSYVCNGADGVDGADGLASLVNVSAEPSGANCTSGGQKIEVGRDLDADGTLDAGEVEQTSYACDGSDGTDGLNSLVTVTEEPGGANCDLGGQKLEVGLDDDSDGVLAAGEVDQTAYICKSGTLVKLSSSPDAATVFNSPDQCYFYQNNLASGIWHAESGRIIAGHFNNNGYWSHPAGNGGYAAQPDNDTSTEYNRIVHMPATGVVVRAGTDQYPSPANTIDVGQVSSSGYLSGFSQAGFSDAFSGNCNLISATSTEFLCYDGTNIRHYETNSGSASLTWTKTVTLSVQPSINCSGNCYGGTFAWDGENYYFADRGNSSSSRDYRAYSATGAHLGLFTANGTGNINSTYFDWSIGRYATHDGFGGRSGADNYTWSGGTQSDDSQCYSGASPYHDGAK